MEPTLLTLVVFLAGTDVRARQLEHNIPAQECRERARAITGDLFRNWTGRIAYCKPRDQIRTVIAD